ncbi:uncharacterized protein LDX57_011423 [Aspergillus melleus]|uniref:uncharacterized protein n=1 Tax=Aspergillus melleus TaxID=138277 RepID=UPI001E8E9524|nr:uncharacterized protein LDX57_011423 [Aspergillus melleus]KAH8433789.1 hypothetical protein LDX57_011423 [Aspergillus melleus]
MTVKIGHDLDVYKSLVNGGPATAKQLAVPKKADPVFVERILRALANIEYVKECGLGLYAPSVLTEEMAQRISAGVIDSLFCDCLPGIVRAPEFLRNTGYQNPCDPRSTPLQDAHGFDTSIWEWMAENPNSLARFNTYMEGRQILDGTAYGPTRPFLVEIAGGRGHDIAHFANRFPDAPGRLILEDLPAVIEDIATLEPKIERVKHDFFTPQPVKGSRVYYMKNILHDWLDEKCKVILDHVIAAMEKGYSKLVLEEFILPDSGAGLLPVLLDMVVMVWCPGMERTCSQWEKFLKGSGLRVVKFWQPPDGQGIIEAEIA